MDRLALVGSSMSDFSRQFELAGPVEQLCLWPRDGNTRATTNSIGVLPNADAPFRSSMHRTDRQPGQSAGAECPSRTAYRLVVPSTYRRSRRASGSTVSGHRWLRTRPALLGRVCALLNGYAPYSTGYAPYTTGYAPAATGIAPYSMGYSGYSSGYTPYGVAYPSTGYRATTGNVPTQSSFPLPGYGTYYGSQSPVIGSNSYGYLTQKPPNNVIVPSQAVLPPTNPVTLVPDYRTNYARTPVTYYRPVLTTDPNTGSQVVTLAPCTSYEYQTQRVPTWGLTQVYNGGATLPAVTPMTQPVSPTYSLPRGGVPLSGPVPAVQPYATAYGALPSVGTSTITPVAPSTNSIITPAAPGALSSPAPYTSGYSSYASNYGNYSALQPAAAMQPRSTYPSTPYSPYYGSGISSGSSTGGCTGGGSTGSYVAPPITTYGASPYGTTTSPGALVPSTSSPALVNPTTPVTQRPLRACPVIQLRARCQATRACQHNLCRHLAAACSRRARTRQPMPLRTCNR